MKIQLSRRVLFSVPVIVGVGLFMGVCASSFTHPPAARYQMRKISDLYPPLGNIPYWQMGIPSEWANEPWTGDDKPYQDIERDSDKALASSWSVGDLLEQTSNFAQQKPNDPQAQFRWSYLARQVVRAQPKTYSSYPAIQAISVVLAHPDSPKTYSYARLRFLVSDQDPDMTQLGERLLQRDPNDVSVKYYLSNDYSALFSERSQLDRDHMVDPQLKQHAITLMEQDIASDPSDPDYRAGLAAVYLASWDDHNNPQDAVNAIGGYQKYLNLAAAEDPFRRRCLMFITELQDYLKSNPLP